MFRFRSQSVVFLSGLIALASAYWMSKERYLVFHVFAEMFSIIIASAISIIAYHTRRIHKNNFLLIVGLSFIFVSLLDLFHLLTYRGMGVFAGYGANVPTQFWVCARSLQIASFLLAFWLYQKPLHVGRLVVFYTFFSASLIAAVFAGVFPACYDESLGHLTRFKVAMESLVCILALLSYWAVYKDKIQMKRRLRRYMLLSLAFFVLSEFSFCLYADVYGFFNFLGHLFKIVSFYYLYNAIVKIGLSRPYELLFADLSAARCTLEKMNHELEEKVAERTAVAEKRANQLRALAAELITAEQREKKKLAHLLHDHLQQLLAAAKMRMSMLKRFVDEGFAAESVDEVTDLLGQSIQCSRELSVELSPPALNESGLTAGLEWLVEWFRQKHTLEVAFTSNPEIRNELPEEVKLFVFNAAREMLFNVVKHAGANEATLKLTYRLGKVFLAVKDDGRGADILPDKAAAGGFGLFSIRERIELLGGQLRISSAPGKGMTAVIMIPAIIEAFEEHRTTGGRRMPAAVRMHKKIRVLIADDHEFLREGLAMMLRMQQDIEVVAQASDGEKAVRLTTEHTPDVVVLDVNMPRLSGVEAAKRIKQKHPDICVVGLSMHSDEAIEQEMLAAGAAAYHRKNGPPEELINAIRNYRCRG